MFDFKIVADSSSDILNLSEVDFSSVPLKIITSEREFIDDELLDVDEMVEFLAGYKSASSTSCPNPQDWLSAMGDAENVFCITMTSALSACHNSAVIAKKIYEERHPKRRVFILDSLSTGPEMKLVIDRVLEMYKNGATFDDICRESEEYLKTTGLFFLLKSMQNLANNGRVSHLAAKAAGLLGIRVLGKASEKGEIAEVAKCRGKSLINTVYENMKAEGYRGGKVKMSYCQNEEDVLRIKECILSEYPDTEVETYPARALCSFYAERGGIIIGFEKHGSV